MFTEKAQAIIDLSKDCAFAYAKEALDVESLLAAVVSDTEAVVRLAECLTNGDVARLQANCPDLGEPAPCPGELDLQESLREIIISAKKLASGDGIPDDVHPGLIDLRHLICALAISQKACEILGGLRPLSHEDAVRILTAWYEDAGMSLSISDLVNKLRGLRSELLSKIFGQDHAVHTFVEGLYNAEVTAAADKERKRPAAVFVFAGPPGVGKTYLSELCASALGRPFKRFDMTGYTDHQAHNQLVGFAQSYKGAQPGLLTGFVEKNPNAILLFDEIEKAHLTTIQLFYQILDAGRLEDKFTENDVSFRDAIIIFTTNAGRSLYDNPNKVGISAANSSYHKRTILNALENEKNPTTGQPAFPQPICSRMAQGYPLMFNHLGINELERVCAAEMLRTETLLHRQYFRSIGHDPVVPIALVFREGGRVDARQLRSEAEKFIKGELFNYCSLYAREKLEDAFEDFDEIRFEIEDRKGIDPEVHALFESPEKPKVLLVSNTRLGKLYQTHIPEIQWFSSSSPMEIVHILSTEDIDMVLLDLWAQDDLSAVGDPSGQSSSIPKQTGYKTLDQGLDFVPLSARALDHGREILRRIHERSPQTPVYLLSSVNTEPWNGELNTGNRAMSVRIDALSDERNEPIIGEVPRRPIDDELFLACVRAGGARGILSTSFIHDITQDWKKHRDQFEQSLLEVNRQIYREKKARALAQERKVLSFDTVSELKREERQLRIKMRDFSLSRAIDALDAGEMVDDVERPNTHFEDVLGAKEAKKSLHFVIDWLKNPKRYTAMGIRPPKGLLLAGPPGTGKTMLGRAVAGESNCAFVEKSASSFVTIWQGSGPQSVRDLFDRARRYAPAVVFIDEIDSIGVRRGGSGGGARAQEETLNALLTEMDGFRSQSQQPVIVLAATNLVEQLDEALKRRFDRTIQVDMPDKEARLQYLDKAVLQRKASQVTSKTVDRVAAQTAGMTIADLERIVHEAAVMAAQEGSSITDAMLEDAFEKFRMGVAKEAPDTQTLKRVARHEAGHAFISWLQNRPPVQVTIVGRGHAGGFMESESDENRMIYTKSEIEEQICVSMGGRAAEIIYYGEEEGLSTGVSGDLRHATAWAIKMVSEFGMAEEFGLVALRENSHYQRSLDGPLALKITETAQRIVKQQLDRAIQILKDNKQYLDKLSEELLGKNRLTSEDLEMILPPVSNSREQQGGHQENGE